GRARSPMSAPGSMVIATARGIGICSYFAREVSMKLVVLGATGGIGLEIVSQAIEQGHSVTAFVRSPDQLKRFGDRLALVRGDLLNAGELAQVLVGQDAILSGFGPRLPISKADSDLLQRFAVA